MRIHTLSPSTERSPLRMHSLRPVPRTITSYSSSIFDWSNNELELNFTLRSGERIQSNNNDNKREQFGWEKRQEEEEEGEAEERVRDSEKWGENVKKSAGVFIERLWQNGSLAGSPTRSGMWRVLLSTALQPFPLAWCLVETQRLGLWFRPVFLFCGDLSQFWSQLNEAQRSPIVYGLIFKYDLFLINIQTEAIPQSVQAA